MKIFSCAVSGYDYYMRVMKHLLPLSLVLSAFGFSNLSIAQTDSSLIGGARFRRGVQILADTSAVERNAALLGMSAGQFCDTCKSDGALRTDADGTLHYACAGMAMKSVRALGTTAESSTTASGGETGARTALSFAITETFRLHSRPASTKKIYLDLDGHVTTNTSWNKTYTKGNPITTPAYSIDADPTFSSEEHARIQMIWKRVKEDFASFDVDVTTEEPAADMLAMTASNDLRFGIRVCIGGSSTEWSGAATGGIAYVGSFRWNTDTPCYVFPAQLTNGQEKYVAESVSHEVGHSLGLTHDGKSSGSQYYGGHNNWAPIMGASFYAGVTQWSKGEYAQASNRQDDLTIMAANGIALLADDVGNTMTAARTLTGSKASFSGVIHNAADVDVFQVFTGAGSITLSVDVGGPQATNLDARISLYDGSGSLVTHANPTGLAATLTTTVSAGTYYVAVEGVGYGDANTGYTDYASTGAYSLTTSLVASSNVAPTVVMGSNVRSGYGPLTVNFSSLGSTDKDGSITRYAWSFGDGSPVNTSPNPSYTYTKTGSYLATLTVWDNTGFSAMKTLTISVQAEPVKLSVRSVTLALTLNSSGAKVLTAAVIVVDAKGQIVSGATVRGTWSGALTSTVSGTTNTSGTASPVVTTTNTGLGVFTVTGLSKSGAIYNSAANVEATKSINL